MATLLAHGASVGYVPGKNALVGIRRSVLLLWESYFNIVQVGYNRPYSSAPKVS